jgi:hypothetical protein
MQLPESIVASGLEQSEFQEEEPDVYRHNLL